MRSTTTFGSIVWMLAACGYDRGNGVAYPGSEVATIALSVASADPMTAAGDTRLVTAVVKHANGSVIPAPSVSWRTSAPSVATVAGSGANATVTAVDDGTAIITAASGSVEATVTVTVRRRAVAIELEVPDSVVVEGFTTQLAVVGRDARQQPIRGLTDVSFASSNLFSVMVSPSGLVTALFSSARPFNSTITATVIVDGATLIATRRIDVASAAPSAFDASALLTPEEVRPEAASSAGAGIIYLERDGDRVKYKLLWSLLSGPPVSAHLHGPDRIGADTVDVLVDLPLGDQLNTHGTLIGSFSATEIRPRDGEPAISVDSLVALMTNPAQVYVDMHTAFFSGGEIRGPIFPSGLGAVPR
jgi:hypothetical protein